MLDAVQDLRRTWLAGLGVCALMALAAIVAAPDARAADECENAELRSMQGATHLPDCRAYEKVSSEDKGFTDADSYAPVMGFPVIIARDRSAIYWCPNTKFGDPPAADQGYCASQFAERGEGAWKQRSDLVPFSCTYNHDGSIAGPSGAFMAGVSTNLERGLLFHADGGTCPSPPLDPAAPQPGLNLYAAELAEPQSFTLLTPEPPSTPGYAMASGDFLGGDEDLSHMIYSSSGQQTLDAPAGSFQKLFEWADGELRFVSKNPAGAPFMTSSNLPKTAYNAVSDTGDKIFFQNPADTSGPESPVAGDVRLYLREDGARTVEVSLSECSADCGAQAGKRFQMATPDGSRVWFTSAERLTDDPAPAGVKLYMYDHTEDPDADDNLTLITPDGEPADGADPGVVAVLNGPSDDGDTIFFVAEGQLIPGEDTTAGYKIYRWRESAAPQLEYLATLPPADEGNPSAAWNWFPTEFRIEMPGHNDDRSPTPANAMDRLVTPDGERLLIQTDKSLDGAADTDSHRDVYVWDEQTGWRCVSCQPPGQASNGRSLIARWTMQTQPSVSRPLLSQFSHQPAGIAMTDDGRVYFESHDRLVPEDQNGSFADVYEWDDGELSLITSGRGQRDSLLLGATPNGENVYFITDERLVGSDRDNLNDIYVARVEGGFPEAEPAPASCEGDGCQGEPSGPRPRPSMGSDLDGDGNYRADSAVASATVRVAVIRRAGARAVIRVRIPGRGRVTVTGGLLRRVVRRAPDKGAMRLTVSLNRRGKARLRRRGHLSATARVAFRAVDDRSAARTVRVAFSRADGRAASRSRGGRR